MSKRSMILPTVYMLVKLILSTLIYGALVLPVMWMMYPPVMSITCTSIAVGIIVIIFIPILWDERYVKISVSASLFYRILMCMFGFAMLFEYARKRSGEAQWVIAVTAALVACGAESLIELSW